jgi:hypothetical protein
LKVAGFSFIRNSIQYDYPIVEAIRSVLPMCDLFVVAVGRSDDGTLEQIRSIGDPRLVILETVWDDSLREGGRVLAEETDKAFQAIPAEYDWCFYIQGDECVHEQDLPLIRAAMERWLDDPATEGLLFDYRHFYGSYDFTGASRSWYRREVRIIRNNKHIRSYRDAQGFRTDTGRKLHVRPTGARIFHYGWVKHPDVQKQKLQHFNRLWHSDAWVEAAVPTDKPYLYDGSVPLERFDGSHPAVMQSRIAAANWQFSVDPTRAVWPWKDRLTRWTERWLGWRPGEYRNYRALRTKQ